MRYIGLVCVFFIICSSVVLAQGEKPENYNNYDSLVLQFHIGSDIMITKKDQQNTINVIKAELSFFPQEDYRQTIVTLQKNSLPKATVKTTDMYELFEWKKPTARRLEYSIDAEIETKNMFVPVNKKIKFPIGDISPEFLKYTKPTEFIDLTPEIEQKAREVIGVETDLYKVIFNLADWNKQNIQYDLSTLTAEAVQKSSWVLKYKQGVCDELTNLFISMLRSVGIPARFVSGMVYSNVNHEWGPHGWAEVYIPEYGWVPFDVTFGQYGWLSPTHIKLKDDMDSGTPSAEYTWQAAGVDIDISEIDVRTSLLRTGNTVPSPISLSVKPYRKAVGPGSVVPMLVTVENKEDYYVSSSIIVLKGPTLTEKNAKEVLLKPKEVKTVPWLMEISRDIDPGFVYTSILEVSSSFQGSTESDIKYSAEYPVMKRQEAQKIVDSYEERAEKKKFDSLLVQCKTDQKTYYEGDAATITCLVKNNGNALVNVNVCIKSECSAVAVNAKESTEEVFTTTMEESGRMLVVAEDQERIMYGNIDVNVIEIPKIYITNLGPTTVNYKEDLLLAFTINSDTPVKDLKLDFTLDELELGAFEGSQSINIHTKGKNLVHGLKMHISFVDEKGKQYESKEILTINVENVPWYAKMVLWVVDLF